MSPWLWVAVGLVGLIGVMLVDTLLGILIWRRPTELDVQKYESEVRSDYVSIVFPGFSNPADHFGAGMATLLLRYGPMYVVRYGRHVTFIDIYAAIIEALQPFAGKRRRFIVYGHSMGGNIGAMFVKAYEQAGRPFGPIQIVFLDCSPGGPKTVKVPGGAWLMRMVSTVWRGGPLLWLAVAGGNLLSRVLMPSPSDGGIDRALFKKYRRGIMWFNPRNWVSHFRFLLKLPMPQSIILTHADVVYIGAEKPKRDKLVDQVPARAAWRMRFPSMWEVLDRRVGHAWPLEQQRVYGQIIEEAVAKSEVRTSR